MGRLSLTFFAASLLFTAPAGAIDIKGSLARLPVLAENDQKGILVNLMRALAAEHEGGKFTFEVSPFSQSMNAVIKKQSDFHLPLLKEAVSPMVAEGFRYSDVTVWQVKFALYTHAKKPVDPETGKNLKIETETAHVGFFKFPIQPSACIECSLRKVNRGEIDGFIFAALESDEIIRRENLSNIRSQLFRIFDVKFVLPADNRGREINSALTSLIGKLKTSGEFHKIMGTILDYYEKWKPR